MWFGYPFMALKGLLGAKCIADDKSFGYKLHLTLCLWCSKLFTIFSYLHFSFLVLITLIICISLFFLHYRMNSEMCTVRVVGVLHHNYSNLQCHLPSLKYFRVLWPKAASTLTIPTCTTWLDMCMTYVWASSIIFFSFGLFIAAVTALKAWN